LNNLNISSLIVNSNTIYAGTNNGVFISTNNGSTWTQTGAYIQNILSLAANGNSIFAGSNYNGVYKSTDNGISWIQTTLNNQAIWSLLISGNNIFAGTNGFGIYLSTNNGTSWTHMGLDNRPIISFAIIGNNIFAGTATSGVYLTTNDGITWVQTSLNDKVVYSLTPSGNNIFAGVQNSPNDSGGVYLSTNNGTTWIKKNQGFNVSLSVNTLLITNDYIFAGTTQSVWRRNLSEILSEVQNIITEIPSKYSLLQNYPNPFNPTTTIKFDIPKSSNVKISVYDITGKEFGVLVNEKLQAGTYQTNWNASNFPSGIYFYRIQAGDFSETKKLILLK
jgi:ribosomal protein S11